MSELTANEATALMAAGMYASPPTEAQMKDGIERAESWLAAHDREVKAEALREAAVAMRAHKDPGHWNLRDERDPANASQSPDAWLEVRAGRIERQGTP